MSEKPILEVRNLKKYFQTPRGSLQAVDDVTFSIKKGETLGVNPDAANLHWAEPYCGYMNLQRGKSFSMTKTLQNMMQKG